MSQIITERPDATIFNFGAVVTGAATIHAALSDDSDASYVTCDAMGEAFVVTGAAAASAAGFQRHRWQVRARTAASTPWRVTSEIVGGPQTDLSGSSISGFPTPQTLTGAWGFIATIHATAAVTCKWQGRTIEPDLGEVRFVEFYFDIDEREAPTFTADVVDGAGISRDAGIVSDTSRPVFQFLTPDYDGLVSRSWTLEVRTVPGGVVVFSASGTGTPPDVQSDPLPNGDYEADLQIFSTIRANDAYASTVENVTFEVAFVAPASPVLTVTPVLSPPAMDVDWTSDTPTATAWDVDAEVVTELRRTDCNGTDTVIYVAQTGIGAATYLDRFMSLTYDGVFCGEADHTCQVCYEARYWGEVDGVLVATDWSTEVCDTVSNPTPGNAWIRGGDSGDLSVCPDESYGLARPFGVFQPIAGGMPTVITATPGGRNYSLSIPANTEADVVSLLAILAQAIVFYQPVAQADLWLSPDSHSVQVTKVGRNRMVDVPFVAVNPQPVVSPSSFF